jgi:hypothetical protein
LAMSLLNRSFLTFFKFNKPKKMSRPLLRGVSSGTGRHYIYTKVDIVYLTITSLTLAANRRYIGLSRKIARILTKSY